MLEQSPSHPSLLLPRGIGSDHHLHVDGADCPVFIPAFQVWFLALGFAMLLEATGGGPLPAKSVAGPGKDAHEVPADSTYPTSRLHLHLFTPS